MRCLSVVVVLALIAVPAGAFAQSNEAVAHDRPRASGEAAPPDDDEDEQIVVERDLPKEKRRVCEMRATTGSIVPKRVCRTVAQIEQDERAARESLDSVNRDREARDQIQLNRAPGV